MRVATITMAASHYNKTKVRTMNRLVQKSVWIMIACCLLGITSTATADLVFTVTDNGSGTTLWTMTGSGVMTGSINPAPAHLFLSFADDTLINPNPTYPLPSNSGSFTIGTETSISEALDDSGFSQDQLDIQFGATIPTGTNLATASGSAVFSVPFANVSDLGHFAAHTSIGNFSVVTSGAAIPEPSAFLFLGVACCAIVVGRRWVKWKLA